MDNLDRYKYDSGFRLISLEIDNEVFRKLKVDFSDPKKSVKSLYTTVFIGPNGTKKSLILRLIIDIFRELQGLINNGKRSYYVKGTFRLIYSNQDSIFEFTNNFKVNFKPAFYNKNLVNGKFHPKMYLFENDKEIPFDHIYPILPVKLIANSIMINDKFPVLINEKEAKNFSIYTYLGIKSNRQQASKRSYLRKTIEEISKNIKEPSFQIALEEIIKFLNLNKSLKLTFRISQFSNFWDQKLNREQIIKYFEDTKNSYLKREKSPPFAIDYYKKLENKSKLIDELIGFRNSLHKRNRLIWQSYTNRKIVYELFNEEDINSFQEEYNLLEELRKLGLLKLEGINLSKKSENEFELENASAGEQYFLTTMIGLVASIRPNSLIIIDEPETSLHPNWQMRYLEFIYQLFDNTVFSSCHFVVATHSHFLISDLDGKKGSIIGLKANGEIKPVKNNTYGWSAEQVLLDIFEVPTTRNRYVADRIGDILELVSQKGQNRDLIRQKVNDLTELNLKNLSKDDPLSSIWSKLIEKYGA